MGASPRRCVPTRRLCPVSSSCLSASAHTTTTTTIASITKNPTNYNPLFPVLTNPRSATLLATLLDLHTHRKSTKLGNYNPMLDVKRPIAYSISPPQPTSYSQAPDPYEAQGQREMSHDIARPYKVQRPIEAQQFGYSAPTEQTTYAGGGGAHWL